jgi:hypothetical protein
LKDLGKPLVESAGLELSLFKNEAVFMLESLDSWLKPEKVDVPSAFEGFEAWVLKQSKGFCLFIGFVFLLFPHLLLGFESKSESLCFSYLSLIQDPSNQRGRANQRYTEHGTTLFS